MLTNPTAQHNHRFPWTHRRLVKRLGSAADAVLTADRSEIERAIQCLLVEREVNVLAINGGDGTIHCAINTMARLFQAEWSQGLREPPVLLLLNGGTYNIASRALGTKGDPVRTVSLFLSRYGQAALQDIPARSLGLLEVRPSGPFAGGREASGWARANGSMLGMVFGSEVVANALDLCDRLGSGYVGLARLLAKGVLGYALRTRFYREHAHLLRPSDPRIEVDHQGFGDAIGAVASTVDLMLARGLVWSLTVAPGALGFHAKVVRGKSPGEVVRLLPHLLWEVPHPMVASFPDAGHLVASGRFTVDGELYDHSGPVEVCSSPLRFRVVSGDDLWRRFA